MSSKAMFLEAYSRSQTPYPQKRQQTLGATLRVGSPVCGKLLKALFLKVDSSVYPLSLANWLFFVQSPVRPYIRGL